MNSLPPLLTHKGQSTGKTNFSKKESLKKAIRGSNDNDVIYLGDVDEIWQPVIPDTPKKLKLRVYAYYLNNLSSEEFWGTNVGFYKDIKNLCFNHYRSDTSLRTYNYHGWHFTSMGGLKEVRRKLNDSYTPESYNTAQVQQLLPQRHEQGIDYLGRNFTFKTDTTHWPDYLKNHRDKYKHLLK